MRFRIWGVVCVLSMLVCAAAAQTSERSEWVGVWRGQLDNLPGVDMVITNEGGELRGAILFYLHLRPDVKSPWTSKAGLPEPLLALKTEGQTLDFQVSHKRAHPPGSINDSPVALRLRLTAPGRAELVNMSEHDGPPLAMTRSAY